MALDLAVSRAITMVHILEKALHDQGPWIMGLNGTLSVAKRVVEESQVVFAAEFPAVEGDAALSLYCGEDLVLARSLRVDSQDRFVAEWALALPQSVAA